MDNKQQQSLNESIRNVVEGKEPIQEGEKAFASAFIKASKTMIGEISSATNKINKTYSKTKSLMEAKTRKQIDKLIKDMGKNIDSLEDGIEYYKG